MTTTCAHHLWGDNDTVTCTRPADHNGGHVYIGRTCPDAHDASEPHGDDQ